MYVLANRHTFPSPVLQQLPIPVVECRLITRVPSNDTANETTVLLGGCLSRARACWIHPAVCLKNAITIFGRDVVRENLEQLQVVLIQHSVFSAM
jgi:hypothetical protein